LCFAPSCWHSDGECLLYHSSSFFKPGGWVLPELPGKLFSVFANVIRSGVGPFADKVLVLGSNPTPTGVLRGACAISFLADHNDPFFSAQHVHGFGAVRGDVEFLTGFSYGIPDSQAIP